jgi:hypothetical protein
MRLLGGAVALAAAGRFASAGAAKDDAPRKKDKRCGSPKLIDTIWVPAIGPGVLTPTFRKGRRYRLRAVGFWTTNKTHGQDAFAAFPFSNHNAPVLSYQGTRLGLGIDNDGPDQWGAYNPNHVYERYLVGSGVGYVIYNTDPDKSDNSGSVFVEVYDCDER